MFSWFFFKEYETDWKQQITYIKNTNSPNDYYQIEAGGGWWGPVVSLNSRGVTSGQE